MAIEASEYRLFHHDFYASNAFEHQRYGQAFYNHFNLHRVADQDQFGNLYELDGEQARAKIASVFIFT